MQEHPHEGHRKRMRERFKESGLNGFAPHEALELLLFHAVPRRDTNPTAHQLIKHFGSLAAVLDASPEQLLQVPGVGDTAATLLSLVARIVRYADRERLGEKPLITNYREAKEFCKHLFAGTVEEVLYVICLDAQGRVIRAVPAITGTIDEIAIYPRTIVGVAMRHNAHKVLLAHNHPSGVREPSDADIHTTELLREALNTVDIAVLDHVIYAEGDCVSMAQVQQVTRSAPFFGTEGIPKAADKKQGQRKKPSPMQEMNDGE